MASLTASSSGSRTKEPFFDAVHRVSILGNPIFHKDTSITFFSRGGCGVRAAKMDIVIFTAHPKSAPPVLACTSSCTTHPVLFLHAALHVMPQSPEFTIAEVSATSVIAQGLGYVVGAGSLLLYTPIAIRVCRQRDASGLTLSTWWLKLISYTCSDVYSFANGYLVSTCVALVAALHTFPCSLEGT